MKKFSYSSGKFVYFGLLSVRTNLGNEERFFITPRTKERKKEIMNDDGIFESAYEKTPEDLILTNDDLWMIDQALVDAQSAARKETSGPGQNRFVALSKIRAKVIGQILALKDELDEAINARRNASKRREESKRK